MKTNNSFFTNCKLGLAMLAVATVGISSPAAANTNVDEPKKSEAAPKLNVSIETFSGTKFRLTLAEPLSGKVIVFVRAQDGGDVLYKGQLENLNGRIFDLSPLADGVYTFEVLANSRTFTQTFELKTQVNRVILAKN